MGLGHCHHCHHCPNVKHQILPTFPSPTFPTFPQIPRSSSCLAVCWPDFSRLGSATTSGCVNLRVDHAPSDPPSSCSRSSGWWGQQLEWLDSTWNHVHIISNMKIYYDYNDILRDIWFHLYILTDMEQWTYTSSFASTTCSVSSMSPIIDPR